MKGNFPLSGSKGTILSGIPDVGSRRSSEGNSMGSTADQIARDTPVRAFSTSGYFCLPNTNGFPLLAILAISELSKSCHRIPEEPLVVKIDADKSGHNSFVGYHDGRVQPPSPSPRYLTSTSRISSLQTCQNLKFCGLGSELLVQLSTSSQI